MIRTGLFTFAALVVGALVWVGCNSDGPLTSAEDADLGTPQLQAITCSTNVLDDGDPEHEAAKLLIDALVDVANDAPNSEFAPTADNSVQKRCRSLVTKIDQDNASAVTDQVNGLITYYLQQIASDKITGTGTASPDPGDPVGDYSLFLLNTLLNFGTADAGDEVAVGVIGPDGGCIQSSNGAFEMCFDPGAEDEPTLYIAQPRSCDGIPGAESSSDGPCYQVEPSGDFEGEATACVFIQATAANANAVATITNGEEEILPFCSNAGPVDSRGIQLAGGTGGLTSHSSPFYPVFEATTIEGTVTDSETSDAIPNAQLELFCEDDATMESPRQTTPVNGDGFYSFDADATVGPFQVGDTCEVHASAPGYFLESSGTFSVERGTNIQNFALDPEDVIT